MRTAPTPFSKFPLLNPSAFSATFTGTHCAHYTPMRTLASFFPSLSLISNSSYTQKATLIKHFTHSVNSLSLTLSAFSMVNRAVVLVFLACCYFVVVINGSGGALTLSSSKLIHRYSEEAKALWVSRSGNVDVKWPKKNSLEYLELLVRNDLMKKKKRKRQNIKLVNHYDLLFPSHGSQTLFFGNDLAW